MLQRAALVLALLLSSLLAHGQDAPDARATPPSGPELLVQRALLEEAHAELWAAEGRPARRALAEALTSAADGAEPRSPMRYAALEAALDAATESDAPALAFAILDRLVAHWRVDAVALELHVLERLAEHVFAEQARAYLLRALATLEVWRDAEQLTAGSRLVEVIADLVEEHGWDLEKARFERAREQLAARSALTALRARVAANPEDRALAHELGWELCFSLGRFDEGLALLVDDADAELAALARLEAEGAADWGAVGVRWEVWGQARTESGAGMTLGAHVQRHAADCYRRALEVEEAAPTRQALERIEEDRLRLDAVLAFTGAGAGRYARPAAASPKLQRKLDAAVDWLLAHQAPNGAWNAERFGDVCGHKKCDGGGSEKHTVGTTSLAVLALLSVDTRAEAGEVDGAIARGVTWLLAQQDPRTGGIGSSTNFEFLYGHAVATQALCVAARIQPQPALREACERAVAFVLAARNPHHGWRYAYPPNGECDTSVTGWMLDALSAARAIGIGVGSADFQAALKGASLWNLNMTDVGTGRTGYLEMGGLSSRIAGVNEQYPANMSEGMTGIGLKIDRAAGRGDDDGLVRKRVELIEDSITGMRLHPKRGIDQYGVLQMLEGLFQTVEADSKSWRRAATATEELYGDLFETRGHAEGSCAPRGPWGFSGGRVYATSMAVLALTVPTRLTVSGKPWE